jgi:hypothetical protein
MNMVRRPLALRGSDPYRFTGGSSAAGRAHAAGRLCVRKERTRGVRCMGDAQNWKQVLQWGSDVAAAAEMPRNNHA